MVLINPVVISVIIMIVLSLLNLNVILSILIAAIVAGISARLPLTHTMSILIDGMGGNAETALSYILLGLLAVAISKTGLAKILCNKISTGVKERKILFILLVAAFSCFSQNLIPIHIAFIPIIVPSLLGLMNKLKIDRRAVACALTFGLEFPYVTIPVGFGLAYHNLIRDEMTANGAIITTNMVWKALLIPGLFMILGLLFAVFISYRKPREYKEINIDGFNNSNEDLKMNKTHYLALIGAVIAFGVQVITKSLPLGALSGIIFMIITGTIKWNEVDEFMSESIKMMGLIAFVMLVSSGYGNVLRQTGAVDSLVQLVAMGLGGSKLFGALLMLLVGLLVTLGIGTSFGTIPILAAIYVPLAQKLGFSILGIIALIGVAGALGDAGSPASDSTLGPTSGLNADGQHNHIWDTCVPTFLHYNIALIIGGTIAALVL
ncbi:MULTISPECIES: Na+/H+ antiporter family protein [Clostridium]|uniref:Na+/H+ antiporter family protein n=1 Tax=Clostridium novyi (strain NT) TaxID=386415 RepID=A0Q2B5_CLONN|nr:MULTISPECIES: Na+/H+ antiporter NhaC family protein [Clostridium]ABK61806.1 Na+/H+ antiporter family protein [Clostridium novyi NT]KEH85055.1 sodium:proton antiporter [Clostridium novyi A str. NCTC 538]KEH85637.1 sodium:proton antiporter [Clostridium novyi A str. 4540]KEH86020.1 sodium:proton antiporter [Clostridium novyi A str. BKT29909]KEH91858.1 sodium:proton antiporter [Clostridium novyi A str. GD211209]